MDLRCIMINDVQYRLAARGNRFVFVDYVAADWFAVDDETRLGILKNTFAHHILTPSADSTHSCLGSIK